MTLSIGGVDFRESLAQRTAGYTFHPREQSENGAGGFFDVGKQWVSWDWKHMQQEEWDWLYARFAASPTTFTLLNISNDEIAFTSGKMKRPVYDRMIGGLYYDVRVEFHNLLPTQA